MKQLIIVVLVAIVLVISGCAGMQKMTLDISKQDLKNAETSRQIGKNFLSTWPLNSGFIRGALGPNIIQLPISTVTALNQLDDLAEKYVAGEITDTDLGGALGTYTRLLSSAVQETLRIYAPDVLKYIPMAFGL
jgi:uncharacterized protein YceK